MKIKKVFNLLLLIVLFNACSNPEPAIIPISEEKIINETGSGDFMAWFDEQDLNVTPATRWSTVGMTSFWPAGLVIDLGRKYKITEVWVYDASKEDHVQAGQIKLSSGKPFEWANSKSVDLQNSNAWVKIDWPAETQFVQLQKNATEQYNKETEFPQNCDLGINEVILMGYPIEKESVALEKPKFVSFNITMDKFIGMNSFIWTPDKIHEAIGCVREYRSWRTNGVIDLNTPISWDPIENVRNSRSSNKGNSDVYYQKMKDMGIECVPCISGMVYANEHEKKPNFGGDPSDPYSYKVMADYVFQYIARYGHKKVPNSLLRTTEAAPKKSGLGLIRYFENWNEPNGWWGVPSGHFTPYQFAAYCSASYDGHMNQMGAGFGAKNADPNIKFVQGGLAYLLPDYLQAMKLWSDYYRNGSFPADVINVHHYCNNRGEQHPEILSDGDHGISPEEDQLKEKLEKLVKWRNENLPDKEIWLSELGWDTDEKTRQSAAFGHKLYPDKITTEEIQGQWLVRGYLISAAAGIDRVMMFLANDSKNPQPGIYGSCGFITAKDEFKPSWYYVKTLKTVFAGMVFHDEYNSGNKNVWIYRFKGLQTGKVAYVLWCPTADGTIVQDYELKLTGDVDSATKLSLADKQEFGVKNELEVINHSVKTDVSERPVIIMVDTL